MLLFKMAINGIKKAYKGEIIQALLVISDMLFLEFIRFWPFSDKTIKYGPLGEYTIINWDKKLVTLGDPTGCNTWRFDLDQYNNLILYRNAGPMKIVEWSPDINLSCWKDLENELKIIIDNRVNQILLEE